MTINRAFLDPLFLGRDPQGILDGPVERPIRAGDMGIIGARPDFMGIDGYSRVVAAPVRRQDGGIGWRWEVSAPNGEVTSGRDASRPL